MSTTIVRRKSGDLLPVLEVDISYKDPALTLVIPLLTPVTFSMRPESSDTLTIDNATASIITSAAGVVRCRYEWQTGQTDQPGEFLGEFTFTLDGKPLTAPSGQYVRILITDSLG